MVLEMHEAARLAFERERNIPFQLPLDLHEINHTCAGKHERLLTVFRELGMHVRYRICWFHWRDLPIPAHILHIPHDDNSSHLYLEVEHEGVWTVLDATWDPGLGCLLPVSTWERSVVAVPAYQTLSPEASVAYLQQLTVDQAAEDVLENGVFFMALNQWFERVRKQLYAHHCLAKTLKIVVDRPLGSKHPEHGFVYPVNYGYVPNTLAPDGEAVDAYILGVDQPLGTFEGRCLAVVHRLNDEDDKLVIVPEGQTMSDEEIKSAIHFQEQWFASRIIRDVNQIY